MLPCVVQATARLALTPPCPALPFTARLRGADAAVVPSRALATHRLQRLDLVACAVPAEWWAPRSMLPDTPGSLPDRLPVLQHLVVRRVTVLPPSGTAAAGGDAQVSATLRWRLPESLKVLAFQQDKHK